MKRLSIAGFLLLLNACGGSGGSSPSSWNTVIVGDMAYCTSSNALVSDAQQTALLTERLKSKNIDLQVITAGDNVYSVGSAQEFAQCYEPTWGRLKSITLPAPGNHDYGTTNAGPYYDYFGTAAGPDRRGYYRLDKAGWTLFSLNSNIDVSPSSAQYAWLKKELASTAGCIAAVWHFPRYTSAARGNNLTMNDAWALLQTAKADVVFQGHEHHYERFASMNSFGVASADGIRSFVVGSGGAPLSDFPNLIAGSEKRIKAFGVLKTAFSEGKMDFQFIDTSDTVQDSGSVTCKPK